MPGVLRLVMDLGEQKRKNWFSESTADLGSMAQVQKAPGRVRNESGAPLVRGRL